MISSFRWMAYLQLAHLRGAFSPGRPYLEQEGFEHVTSVLLTGGGGPDICFTKVRETRVWRVHSNDYVINASTTLTRLTP